MPPNLTYEQCLQVTFPSDCPPANCSHLIEPGRVEPPTSNGTGTFTCIGHTSLCLWIMLLLLCVALTYVCSCTISMCAWFRRMQYFDYCIAGNFPSLFSSATDLHEKFFPHEYLRVVYRNACNAVQGKRNFYSRKSPCCS